MDELRYYQTEAIEGAFEQWKTHQSTAIISCTGSGKTEMYMAVARMMPGRVLVLVHRDYLDAAEELYEKLPLLGGLMRLLKRAANR